MFLKTFVFLLYLNQILIADQNIKLKNELFNPAEHPEFKFSGGNPEQYVYVSDSEIIPDEHLGFRHPYSKSIRHITRTKEHVIWDVTLTYDEFGHRFVPQTNSNNKSNFIILSGCSFVQGTGLNDNETLSYFLAQKLLNYRVYNFAIGASGTNIFLASVDHKDFVEPIKERGKGYWIYMPLGGHVQRSIGTFQLNWVFNTPWYEETSDGEMIYSGTIASKNPVRVWLIKKIDEYLNAYFWKNNWDFPKMASAHYTYVCKLIAEADRRLEKRGIELVVFPHPMAPLSHEVVSCLKQKQIRVLEWDLLNSEFPTIPIDGHPAAGANEKIADFLFQKINQFH